VSLPLNLDYTELTLVNITHYFDVVEGSGEERIAEFALLRFIELARRGSQRGREMAVPGCPRQQYRRFFRDIESISVGNAVDVARCARREAGWREEGARKKSAWLYK